MKEPKPFRSPRTSPSFPEAQAAILIFLELTKKNPHLYTENCIYGIHYFTFLFSSAMLDYTHTSIDVKRIGPHIFISQGSVFTQGINSVLQASRKLLRVGEMCELEHSLASGDAQLHTTLPLSLLVYSPSPSPSLCLCHWCLTCRSDSRGS